MQVIRQRKNVVDKRIIVKIPDSFGSEVEIIVLSNADEKTNTYENRELLNVEDRIWSELTVKEFISSYSSDDSIYDKSES